MQSEVEINSTPKGIYFLKGDVSFHCALLEKCFFFPVNVIPKYINKRNVPS